MRDIFIAGNWKMHKNRAEAGDFALALKRETSRLNIANRKIALCAPYLQLEILKEFLKDSSVKVGAQNVHFEDEGAFTGEISVPMLEELGIDFCIVGHSERRNLFGETDGSVNQKIKRLLKSSVKPIICIGETLEERRRGHEKEVIEKQLRADLAHISPEEGYSITFAYEPLWAIGTGETATPVQAQKMCAFIRKTLAEIFSREVAEKILIQYGGSVKASNTREILSQPDIDGALVGGASLKIKKFIEIIVA